MTVLHWQERDKEFLPDSGRWGRGYGGKPYTDEDLNETAGYLKDAREAGDQPEGYSARFFASTPGFQVLDSGDLVLPDGFDALTPSRSSTPQRLLEATKFTSAPAKGRLWQLPAKVQELHRESGWVLDQNGRACNPHGLQLIKDPRIGLNTNLGCGWYSGETPVVDVVVDDGDSVLFTTRIDLGKQLPSLVGGYCWSKDFGVSGRDWRSGNRPITQAGLFKAAKRIVRGKTGITLPEDAVYTIVWGIRPASSRQTMNFWTCVYTIHVRIDRGMSRHLEPGQNSQTSFWMSRRTSDPVTELLWPDHYRGWQAAMSH